jgi:MFS family permease
MQFTASFLAIVPAVLGPIITEAAGVSPERIGHLSSAGALGTVWFLMSGTPLLRRLGPVRLLQVGAVIGAMGVLLVAAGWWPVMLLGALLVGIGYGPSPPAGSDILARHAPKHRHGLVFSVKQSAVPLGYALAGGLLPPIALAADWRLALVAAALIALVSAVVVQPLRAPIDVNRDPRHPITPRGLLALDNLRAPFRAVGLSRALPGLTIAGFCFAFVQGSLFSYLVTYLSSDLGLAIAAAGAAFAAMQTAGFGARIAMGWLADRIGSARRTMIMLAMGGGTMILAVSSMSPTWPWWLIAVTSGLAGATAGSWNGVYLAELARVAPPGKVGEATSGSTFFTFMGYVAGPSTFSALIGLAGGYGAAFVLTATMSAIAGLTLAFLTPRT